MATMNWTGTGSIGARQQLLRQGRGCSLLRWDEPCENHEAVSFRTSRVLTNASPARSKERRRFSTADERDPTEHRPQRSRAGPGSQEPHGVSPSNDNAMVGPIQCQTRRRLNPDHWVRRSMTMPWLGTFSAV
jgi:hypothetical protein